MIPTTMLQELAKDKTLSPHTLRVYFILVGELDFRVYRHVKQHVLALTLDTDQSTVSRALQTLVEATLVELGPRDGAGNTYRLVQRNRFNPAGEW